MSTTQAGQTGPVAPTTVDRFQVLFDATIPLGSLRKTYNEEELLGGRYVVLGTFDKLKSAVDCGRAAQDELQRKADAIGKKINLEELYQIRLMRFLANIVAQIGIEAAIEDCRYDTELFQPVKLIPTYNLEGLLIPGFGRVDG